MWGGGGGGCKEPLGRMQHQHMPLLTAFRPHTLLHVPAFKRSRWCPNIARKRGRPRVLLKEGEGGSWNPKVQKFVDQKQPNQYFRL